MNWSSVLGLMLIGGFVIYLIAAGRLDYYLAMFTSPGPSYGSGATAPAPSDPNAPTGSPFGDLFKPFGPGNFYGDKNPFNPFN